MISWQSDCEASAQPQDGEEGGVVEEDVAGASSEAAVKKATTARGDSSVASASLPLPQITLPPCPLAEKSVNPVVESNQPPKTDTSKLLGASAEVDSCLPRQNA